jgi:hypothetical protein
MDVARNEHWRRWYEQRTYLVRKVGCTHPASGGGKRPRSQSADTLTRLILVLLDVDRITVQYCNTSIHTPWGHPGLQHFPRRCVGCGASARAPCPESHQGASERDLVTSSPHILAWVLEKKHFAWCWIQYDALDPFAACYSCISYRYQCQGPCPFCTPVCKDAVTFVSCGFSYILLFGPVSRNWGSYIFLPLLLPPPSAIPNRPRPTPNVDAPFVWRSPHSAN